MKDKRKKGCPNIECDQHKNKIMQNSDDEYCPKCGTKLVYVCAKCFSEIEDIDFKHRICSLCEAKAIEKKQKLSGIAKKAGKAVASVVVPVGVGIVGKVVKDGQKGAINAGVNAVEGVAKAFLKKK